MSRLLRKVAAWLAALMLVSCVSAALAAEVAVTVNTDSARVYQSPSTSSASVPLPKGLDMTMTGVSGDWARVTYRGVTGYCALKVLDTRSRYPAYTSKDTYIYQSADSGSAKVGLAANTKVYVIGRSGDFYRVQNESGAVTGYIAASCLAHSPVAVAPKVDSAALKAKVVKLDWFKGGSEVLQKGSYGYIYDIKTGVWLRVKRMGGHNHADLEPATAADTAKLFRIAGGKWSWDTHSVILYAGGKLVACAINANPHGTQTIADNGFDGQFCLHMVNSLTHETEKVNEYHQAAIEAAYNWAHK